MYQLMDNQDGSITLRPQGEMTIYSAAGMKAPLIDALSKAGALEINLGEVTEIDTAGIQLLILAKREAEASGKRLTLVEHSPAALELIELYNLAGWFGDPLVIPAGRA